MGRHTMPYDNDRSKKTMSLLRLPMPEKFALNLSILCKRDWESGFLLIHRDSEKRW